MSANNRRKQVLGVLAGILAFALAYFAVQKLFFAPATFDEQLMRAASELNKTCPLMVDQDTQLDNAIALPENVFQYNYTLVNLENSDIDVAVLKAYLTPEITNNVRTNPSLKAFRDNKVTMSYYYKDKKSAFVVHIIVTPDQYAE